MVSCANFWSVGVVVGVVVVVVNKYGNKIGVKNKSEPS